MIVHLACSPDASADDAVRSLAGLVAGVLGVGVDRVTLPRACPVCASAAHGPRSVLVDGRPSGVHASLSRCPGLHVVAVSEAPVGVDIERVGAVDASVAGVLLAPGEPAGDLTRTWVRKEALLKAAGRGLAVDPRSVRLDGVRVVAGPRAALADVDLGPELVCAVVVLGDSPLHLRLTPDNRSNSR